MSRSRYFSTGDEMHRELGMMALAASPTPEDACAFLAAEHKLRAKPSHLAAVVRMRPEQYEELRAKIVPLKEQTLTHNMLDDALYCSDVTRVAMEQLMERLDERKIPAEYLSRVARDMADVRAKAIDKKLALEGRPGVITETRSAPEIIKKLESMGVINPPKSVDATATAIEEPKEGGDA